MPLALAFAKLIACTCNWLVDLFRRNQNPRRLFAADGFRPAVLIHPHVFLQSFGDGMFSEPLDLAMGGRLDPLQLPEGVPEPQKKLSHMTRQERREYLRSRELAARQKAEGEERTDHLTMAPGLETPPSRPGIRMHNPPPVRLGMADGFGLLGWKL
jgi:hypothetical protein